MTVYHPKNLCGLPWHVFLAVFARVTPRPRGCLRMQGCVQAALARDIQETMRAWAQRLQECALVFVHAPAANAGPLFQGEAPPLPRGDRRVRSVPFTTRRPTFSETKRVAQLLLTASAAEAPQAAAPPPAGVLNTAATASIARQQQEMGCMYFGLRQPGALRMCSAPYIPMLAACADFGHLA